MTGYRRVVTRIDANGKSEVVSDNVPPVIFRAEGASEIEIAEIWATTNPASVPSHSSDPTCDNPAFLPTLGETRFRIVTIGPTKSFDLFSALHRSNLVEYLVVLSGQIQLVLPSGNSLLLSAGDYIVQEGTEHAWNNPYSEPCSIAVILIGTELNNPNDSTS